MRMNAETMKRNGIVYAAIKELLSLELTATPEMISHFTDSVYNEKDVKKAVTSLEKANLVTVGGMGYVTEIHPFPEA